MMATMTKKKKQEEEGRKKATTKKKQKKREKEDEGSVVLLNVLGCRLTYQGQAETSAEAWFNIALRPRKP